MRAQHTTTIACAAAVLLFGSLSFAQVTKYQEDQNLGVEAHVGKLTGQGAGFLGANCVTAEQFGWRAAWPGVMYWV